MNLNWQQSLSRIAIALVGCAIAIFVSILPAHADAPNGEQLFSANCSACHIGGNNVIISHKTLRKEALEKYEMNSIEAIRHQVIHGKNAMPAFGERLSEEEIEAIASYVLGQAETGWSTARVEPTTDKSDQLATS
ncbi:cytochrome c6 PetJ [Leptolyngbya sp. NIES-2104]|uniref:cytochrome c6 PetJ n=1 Tax=Leptolyngbya sp. NIES-2104 TaxID=1552121 RepID=UPI0006EC8C6A|nr:c-type cytochrome [Leptolyngbya sp. NIES-2104]GAP94490.1 cytochrome C553 [Leptolyngbya sp. NIES-2104]